MVAINWHTFFFLLFALATCVFALAVLFTSNIVRMAFYLVMTLGAVAGLFFLAGADFVGAMQLMIYVGGTVVLLVFGVMLTARTPFVSMRTGVIQWVLAALVGGPLLLILVNTAFSVHAWRGPTAGQHTGNSAQHAFLYSAGTLTDVGTLGGYNGVAQTSNGTGQLAAAPTATPLGLGLMGVRVDQLEQPNRAGMAGYLLPFEIISVHLLVVLVGAAYLARAKRRTDNARMKTE